MMAARSHSINSAESQHGSGWMDGGVQHSSPTFIEVRLVKCVGARNVHVIQTCNLVLIASCQPVDAPGRRVLRGRVALHCGGRGSAAAI